MYVEGGPVFRIWILGPFTGLWIWIWIRIRVFSAVAFKMRQQKISFLLNSYRTVGTLTSVFKDNMSLRSHNTVEIMIYRTIFA
jgi:hypothetical protein